jgi:integrase
MPLSQVKCKNAKPKSRTYRLFDEKGLYLEVTPKDQKWWRLKYRFSGKEKRISLGVFPEVSLKEVRDLRDDARQHLRNNVDPSAIRKAQKKSDGKASDNSFEVIAREWHAKQSSVWSESYSIDVMQRIERNAFPIIGQTPIQEITTAEILEMLRLMEKRGLRETTFRIRAISSQIFRYAIVTDRTEHDPAANLIGSLTPRKRNHFATITDPEKIGQLLRAIDNYEGEINTRIALSLAPYVFVRPGELRRAEWSEIDFKDKLWRIPADKMKKGIGHVVPLAKQSISLLKEIEGFTGRGRYLFPSIRTSLRPMSENTINAALRRLGYLKEEMTGHGFRSMASTRLNEMGWDSDLIERQLAHTEKNAVRGAYNFAEYLSKRRKMMQSWADYLDGLK